MLYTNNVD